MLNDEELILILKKMELLVTRDDITISRTEIDVPKLATITNCDMSTLTDIADINKRMTSYVVFTSCLPAAEKAKALTSGDIALVEIAITAVNKFHSTIEEFINYTLGHYYSNDFIFPQDKERLKQYLTECLHYLNVTRRAAKLLSQKFSNILDIPPYEEYDPY